MSQQQPILTEAQEAEFQAWWTRFGQPYEAAVIENGGQPWTTDINERRRLWARRYRKPQSPVV